MPELYELIVNYPIATTVISAVLIIASLMLAVLICAPRRIDDEEQA